MKKALLFLHELGKGGHSITAVELAASVRDQCNWEVVIFGSPGAVAGLAEQRGLRVIPGRPGGIGISPRDMRMFWSVCREESPDIVHAWDWRPIFNAYYSAHLAQGIPLLGSVTAMYPPAVLPPDITVSFITEDIRAHDPRRRGRNFVLDAPINDAEDDPSLVDGADFCTAQGLEEGTVHVVIVSRLVRAMKLDGILRTIEAVAELATEHAAVDLVIVGDGEATDEVRVAADAANDRIGHTAIKLAGPMLDPRPAYAAADIVVGMGTSSVRAMAFGKPVVVVGEDGFAETFDEQSASELIAAGLYGYGPGPGANPALRKQLEELVGDPDRRHALGAYARGLVVQRFGVAAIARGLAARYDEIVAEGVRRSPPKVARALGNATAIGLAYQLKTVVPWRIRERFWHRHEVSVRKSVKGPRS